MSAFCQKCGDGVETGNHCAFCDVYPFCDTCSEKSGSFDRVCVDCKFDDNLNCLSCNALVDQYCTSCWSLHNDGMKSIVNRACSAHFADLFCTDYGDGLWTYFNCNSCDSVICSECIDVEEGVSTKNYFCSRCDNELEICQM